MKNEKPKGRVRNKKFNFYVTEKEEEFIRDKAKYLDMTISRYLRTCAMETVIIKKDFNEVFYNLNKIGTNINQIAKKVNTSGVITERDFDELKAEMNSMFELYYNKILDVN